MQCCSVWNEVHVGLLCGITPAVTGPWSEDVKSKIGEAHGSGAPFC